MTGDGLSRFSNGTFTTLSTKDGLPSNTILSFAEAPSGALWLGTAAGLSLLAPDRVKFKYKLIGYDQDWVEAETRAALPITQTSRRAELSVSSDRLQQ